MSSPWDKFSSDRGTDDGPPLGGFEQTGTSCLGEGEPEGEDVLKPSPEIKQKPPPHIGGSLVSVVCVVYGPGKDVCGGKIGDDEAKFCTLPCGEGTTSCGRYVKHEKEKADIPFPAYFMCTPKPKVGSAFCQPVLLRPPSGLSNVAISVVDDGQPRSINEWREVFTVLSGFAAFSSDEQQHVLDRIANKTSMGPTPMKPRKLTRIDDSMEEMSEVSESWVIKSPNLYSAWLLEEFEDDSVKMAQIQTCWNDMVRTLMAHRQNTERNYQATQGVMEAIDNKVVKLISVVGQPNEMIPAPDLWSSIIANSVSLKAAKLERAEQSTLVATYKDHVVAMEMRTVELVNTVRDDVAVAKSGVEHVTNEITQKMFPVVDAIYQRVGRLELAGGSGASSGLQSKVDQITRLLDALGLEVQELKSGNKTAPHSLFGSTNASPNSTALEDTVAMLVNSVATLQSELKGVQLENTKLRQELNSDGATFGGHDFPNKESYMLFILNHNSKGYHGVSYDFISFLECQIDQNRTSDEAIKSLKTLSGVGYDDLSSGRIDTSFSTLLPRIFGKEQDPKDPSKKMEKLTSMDIWDHPSSQSGMKHDIQSFITTYADTARGQVEYKFPVHTSGYRFFTFLIDHVVTFWNHLETWVTRFERELAAQCGGDDPGIHKAYIWKLICWMLHEMFKEFQVRRQPGKMNQMTAGIQAEGDKRLKAASVLQGTIAAHKFMAELVKAGFIRHPIFASTMVEFLLKTKASHASMVEVVKKQKVMDTKLTGIQSNVDKLLDKKKAGAAPMGAGGARS